MKCRACKGKIESKSITIKIEGRNCRYCAECYSKASEKAHEDDNASTATIPSLSFFSSYTLKQASLDAKAIKDA